MLCRLVAVALIVGAVPNVSMATSPASPLQQQLGGGRDVWPPDWFSDFPAVDLTGTWVFSETSPDPMLEAWVGSNPRYTINQQAAFIVVEFFVDGQQPNRQHYTWNGAVERFERGDEIAEEAARWTEAGRRLEIIGRSWTPDSEDDRKAYSFSYTVRARQLILTQESESGKTVWHFDKVEEG